MQSYGLHIRGVDHLPDARRVDRDRVARLGVCAAPTPLFPLLPTILRSLNGGVSVGYSGWWNQGRNEPHAGRPSLTAISNTRDKGIVEQNEDQKIKEKNGKTRVGMDGEKGTRMERKKMGAKIGREKVKKNGVITATKGKMHSEWEWGGQGKYNPRKPMH